MTTSASDHDVLDSDRIVAGVYACNPPPQCRLGHILRHARPFGEGWTSGSTIEPGFVLTQRGHYTKIHMDVGAGMLVHFVALGTKVWVLFPPTGENLELFRATEWGHNSDVSLEYMCLKANKIYFVVTRPGSVFVQPANWLHAVITVHAEPVAFHTSLEVLHLETVPSVVGHIIPLIVLSLTQYATSPDKDWLDDVCKILRQESVQKAVGERKIQYLSSLLTTVGVEPSQLV
jgi:hypothetical protein